MSIFKRENVQITCTADELKRIIAYIERKSLDTYRYDVTVERKSIINNDLWFKITLPKSCFETLPLTQAIDRVKRGVLD